MENSMAKALHMSNGLEVKCLHASSIVHFLTNKVKLELRKALNYIDKRTNKKRYSASKSHSQKDTITETVKEPKRQYNCECMFINHYKR